MTRQTVRLVEGPFHGQTRQVDPYRKVLTEEYVVETVEVDGYLDGCALTVERLELATYRRMSEWTFVHCRTPTRIGDSSGDLAFPERQLGLDDV